MNKRQAKIAALTYIVQSLEGARIQQMQDHTFDADEASRVALALSEIRHDLQYQLRNLENRESKQCRFPFYNQSPLARSYWNDQPPRTSITSIWKPQPLADTSLERFVKAQAPDYDRVVRELQHGRKESHWMWFIFPQLKGLSHSWMGETYAIQSLAEAQEYLAHPILGPRLRECTELVLAAPGRIGAILGTIDDVKFQSCMTLFAQVDERGGVFECALQEFFGGHRCQATRKLLEVPTP